MSYLSTLLIGVALAILVYGTMSLLLLWLSSVFIVPSKKLPTLPAVLALIIAWFLSWPAAGLLIQNTFLANLQWGHAAELFGVPYILVTPVMFLAALVAIHRKRPQDPDASAMDNLSNTADDA
jgi:hypothetical protein